MPTKRFCRCGKIVEVNKTCVCGAGTRKGWGGGSTTDRGYGSDWRELSKRIRTDRPLCEDCLVNDVVRPATEVHHVVPINTNPGLRLTVSNLKALCKECHDKRHGT